MQSGVDAAGHPVQERVATYAYQERYLSSVTNGRSQVTSYRHTDWGTIGYLMNVNLGYQAEYARDARGNLVTRTGGTVYLLQYTYDGLDRLRSIAAQDTYDANASTISYELRYDERGYAGRLTTVVEPTRTVTFEYDAAGRLWRETSSEGVAPPLVTEYRYDVAGQLSELVYPSGLATTFERDSAGQIRKVRTSDGAHVFADAIERWPGGPLSTFTFGSGETFAATVNRRYEPVAIRSGPLALDYTMAPSGDVAAIQEGATTTSFGYDFRDRLTSYSLAGGSDYTVELASSQMDRIKRLGTFSGSTLVSGYAFDRDTQDNVSSVGAIANGSVTEAVCLRHDALGRLTLVGPGTNQGGDRLSCARDNALTSVSARYTYDVRNRRVARWLATTGEWTYFVYAATGELLSELRVAGGTWAPLRDYVWLEGRPLAQIEYDATGAPHVYYVHADHLGTPRRLTSAQGALVWSASVLPYGEITETTAPDPATGQTIVTNLWLPGQYDERLLGSIGLQGPYYNWNRWYLPGVGRYLELDPLALRGHFNARYGPDWYNYANGNPLRYIDPLGLYGTNDCSYYEQRCAESGGKYYCEQARTGATSSRSTLTPTRTATMTMRGGLGVRGSACRTATATRTGTRTRALSPPTIAEGRGILEASRSSVTQSAIRGAPRGATRSVLLQQDLDLDSCHDPQQSVQNRRARDSCPRGPDRTSTGASSLLWRS